jgi:hypothetical protein
MLFTKTSILKNISIIFIFMFFLLDPRTKQGQAKRTKKSRLDGNEWELSSLR